MKEWISAQGGDVSYIEDTSRFEKSRFTAEILAETDGYISSMNAEALGNISVILGAGRASKDDIIDHTAGILMLKKTGDRVNKGDVLCTLYSNNEAALKTAEQQYLDAVKIGEKAEGKPLVYKVII